MGILVLIVIIVVLATAAVYLTRFFARKATRDVVLLFRARGAISPKTATTAEELKLVRAGVFQGVFKLRDYRPDALHLLVRANIIRATGEGRLYLSEDELAHSQIKKIAKIE